MTLTVDIPNGHGPSKNVYHECLPKKTRLTLNLACSFHNTVWRETLAAGKFGEFIA